MSLALAREEYGIAPMREAGYYWVRRYGESKFQIGRWSGLNWHLIGMQEPFTDDSFADVSGRVAE